MSSSPARQVALRLLAREERVADPTNTTATVALQNACTRMSANLRRSLGDDGHDALIARALRRTEVDHPALAQLRRVDDGGITLDAIDAAVAQFGWAAVSAALEALIAAVVEILSSLIGADMALTLLDYDGPGPIGPAPESVL